MKECDVDDMEVMKVDPITNDDKMIAIGVRIHKRQRLQQMNNGGKPYESVQLLFAQRVPAGDFLGRGGGRFGFVIRQRSFVGVGSQW